MRPSAGVWKPERFNVQFVKAETWGNYALINVGPSHIREIELAYALTALGINGACRAEIIVKERVFFSPRFDVFAGEAKKLGMLFPEHGNFYPAYYQTIQDPKLLKDVLVWTRLCTSGIGFLACAAVVIRGM